eukprot:Sspe_Gene.75584::Locus_47219_Transcript_1_1_Confidence_1.000_Length_1006::g.75584::m.75584
MDSLACKTVAGENVTIALSADRFTIIVGRKKAVDIKSVTMDGNNVVVNDVPIHLAGEGLETFKGLCERGKVRIVVRSTPSGPSSVRSTAEQPLPETSPPRPQAPHLFSRSSPMKDDMQEMLRTLLELQAQERKRDEERRLEDALKQARRDEERRQEEQRREEERRKEEQRREEERRKEERRREEERREWEKRKEEERREHREWMQALLQTVNREPSPAPPPPPVVRAFPTPDPYEGDVLGYEEWRRQLDVWEIANPDLPEDRKAPLVLQALKGDARAVVLTDFPELSDLRSAEGYQKLRGLLDRVFRKPDGARGY